MTQLDGALNATPNEFQYAYDQAGRLRHAAFAQTPQRSSPPYYTWDDPAQTRAHTLYSYDGAGRSTEVRTYFETWIPPNPSGGEYGAQSKIGQVYTYDERGLRSTQEFFSGVPGSETLVNGARPANPARRTLMPWHASGRCCFLSSPPLRPLLNSPSGNAPRWSRSCSSAT